MPGNRTFFAVLAVTAMTATAAGAADDMTKWPLLTSTFPSTGGGGITIKGYDPVIVAGRCITTFMAVTPGDKPEVYANLAEFDAVPTEGGVHCRNGRWRSFDGQQTGTTPFEIFLKDGVFRARP
jgi:hypothetical protein